MKTRRISLHPMFWLLPMIVLPLFSQPDSLSVAGEGRKLSFGYANDNFLFGSTINNLLDERLFPDHDDHVTGSFFISAFSVQNQRLKSAEVLYHIVTHRPANYRTDIAALRVTLEDRIDDLRWRAGIGFHLVGDLGGESVQNAYHRFSGITEVRLKYPDALTGGARMTTRMEYFMVESPDRYDVSAFASLSVSTNTLPNMLRAGFSSRINAEWMNLEWNGGYARRFKINRDLAPVFGSSLFAAVLADVPLSDRYSVTGWMTQDQFGIRGEVHFGVSLSWNAGKQIPAKVRDITFP